MTLSIRVSRFLPVVGLLGCLLLVDGRPYPVDLGGQVSGASNRQPHSTPGNSLTDTAQANNLIRRQPGFFVPNLGQWEHAARYVHRCGPMTVFLEHRGWVLDLVERPVEDKAPLHGLRPQEAVSSAARDALSGVGKVEKLRGVALRMTFEGDTYLPEIVGEKKLSGYHNYFLGNDKSHWRTHVPLYGAVRYESLYPGIDLRLREMNKAPEYDLLLEPGADLSLVTVRVEGGQGLSIARDGSLVISTALGPVIQPKPRTWQVGGDGKEREVACRFNLLGADRFGFLAPGWDGDTNLTIDPGLIWSTYLGGNGQDYATAVAVDPSGVVTASGYTFSTFPTTTGAYDTSYNGNSDIFVTRLDPSQAGGAQLVYSTRLGGGSADYGFAVAVDVGGVVTVSGYTSSTNFPTTTGAHDTSHNGSYDAFISRLDPGKSGQNQLVYSTLLGGSGSDYGFALSVDTAGVATISGYTASSDFPTRAAYATSYGGSGDAFVSRVDPSKPTASQLVYSTFLGGSDLDSASAVSADAMGVVTVSGYTRSSNFPTTSGAYDQTPNGSEDVFVSRLDPTKSGKAQLLYSTFLGGSGSDLAYAQSVDANGVVTVAGHTTSTNFPTTSGAYNSSHSSPGLYDIFVSRLDPRRTSATQLTYSTLLGGSSYDQARGLWVDTNGIVTVAGYTTSTDYPTTSGAYSMSLNGGNDASISRLDPNKTGGAQLVHSTFLGGSGNDFAYALSGDPSGVVTVAGYTSSTNLPTNQGYNATHNGGTFDAFISRLDMGVAFYGDRHELLVTQGGIQKLTLNAGKQHAGRSYWIFGSVTGTTPGINLLGLHFPLNPDFYTNVTIGSPTLNPPFVGFMGKLDGNGQATASFNVPKLSKPLGVAVTLYHAYLVYDAQGRWHMVSNAVPLTLK